MGAADTAALARIAGELSTIPAVREIGPETSARLVARHGTEAPAVVALGAELDLLHPLVPGSVLPGSRGRLGCPPRDGAVRSTMSSLRRTRLAQELPDRGASIAPRVAAILATDLDWGAARQRLEVDSFLASARDANSRSRRPDGPAPAEQGTSAADL